MYHISFVHVWGSIDMSVTSETSSSIWEPSMAEEQPVSVYEYLFVDCIPLRDMRVYMSRSNPNHIESFMYIYVLLLRCQVYYDWRTMGGWRLPNALLQMHEWREKRHRDQKGAGNEVCRVAGLPVGR